MELNFLTIADTPEDLKNLRSLLASFEREKQIQLLFRRVGWERAWQALLLDAVEGKGPHVSQIGSTWVATMAMLESLRAFSTKDLSAIGDAAHFLPAAWQSVKFADRSEVWAIPWSIYTFVLYYRRDLLEKAGVDPATAFITPEAMCATFAALSKNGTAPWAFPSLHPYADLVHIASSWARANGGDFMSENEGDPRFATEQVSIGLMDFFELFPFLPLALRGLNIEACTNTFARGEVATLIGGVEIGNELMATPYASQQMRENVAVTTLPGIPWIGGDHLVIWKNVLADQEHERAALDLTAFLSRKETQVAYFKLENILPARADAYDELTFPLETTRLALQKALQTGRPHPALRLWHRIEAFLDEMLLDIGSSVLRQPGISPSDIAGPMLNDYEKKFTAVLRG
jgi:multiple sugar transport system substrate-binding protein